jgi:hypothetical protein
VGHVFDLGFVLAVGALGWGLSLATYRTFAVRHRWPMGAWQARRPLLPFLVGAACAVTGAAAAGARLLGGESHGGVLILLFGAGWAVFWTGFLQAGAQSALLLAPSAALLLLAQWPG